MNEATKHPVILFDGVCNLCSNVVQFIIKHDPKRVFRFASLQSSMAKELLKEYHLPPDELNTFVLIENGKAYTHSTGALRIAKHLKGAWPLAYGFIIVPRFIRDAVYNFISKKRYNWFGKKEDCWIPKQEWTSLFLEE
jgi:predicted DCC family thiol-disulfide oxidoreductase YuxK